MNHQLKAPHSSECLINPFFARGRIGELHRWSLPGLGNIFVSGSGIQVRERTLVPPGNCTPSTAACKPKRWAGSSGSNPLSDLTRSNRKITVRTKECALDGAVVPAFAVGVAA